MIIIFTQSLKEDDLDAEIVKDILATRLSLHEDFPDKNKRIPGYCQEISVWPFRVLMFTKMQLELLNRTTKRFGPRTLQVLFPLSIFMFQ